MFDAAYGECAQAEYTGIALEYGTLPQAEVMRALRADQWLENHPEADEATQRTTYVEQIQRQFDLMAGMTREVLAFARGDTDLVVRKVYVNRYTEELTTQPGFGGTQAAGVDRAEQRRHDQVPERDPASRSGSGQSGRTGPPAPDRCKCAGGSERAWAALRRAGRRPARPAGLASGPAPAPARPGRAGSPA